MIADRTTGRTVESTLGGTAVQMGISIEDMPHIMNLLTDIYSEPEHAALREYSTNAYDAQVEAGVTRPIEVTLPTRLSPFLRIKDFGVGMDKDTIERVYSQYGRSTKRESNDFNGMLGIGGKSALTYTDQFTVISRKDGHTIQVSVSRAESGAGVMQIVTDTLNEGKHPDFSKPSGTEIIIPAKLPNSFDSWANHLFGFWKPGTVLVNGEAPAQRKHLALVGEPGEGKDGDVWIIDGSQSYVVMGNVPYKAEVRHDLPSGYDYVSRSYHEDCAVAVFAPIGAVNFPPSREEVMTDRKTQEAIRAFESVIAASKRGAVQRNIDAETTATGAIQAMLKWCQTLGLDVDRNAYTWQGAELPRSFEPETELEITGSNGGRVKVTMLISDNSESKLGKAERRESLAVGKWPSTLIAYGYDRKGMTPTQKKKLRKYVTDHALKGIKRFALVAEKPDATLTSYIGAERVVKWEDINAIKLPSLAGDKGWTGRLAGSYDFFKSGVWEEGIAGNNIDRTYDIFYVHGNYGEGSSVATLLTKHFPNNYVVCLSANRIDKFCRIIPAAKEAHVAVKEVWQRAVSKFTDVERLALHMQDQGVRERLKALDASRIKDPALRAAINWATVDISAIEKKRTEFDRVVRLDSLDAVEWENPLASYPLYAALWEGYLPHNLKAHRQSDDMYLYLNAKFEADQAATTTKGA
jgi:hypothetical protein